jgi:PAS domain S-box-containing protein
MKKFIRAGFIRKILLPALLAIILFVISVFSFVIPSFRENAIEQKQKMLRELTNTAWSILDKYRHDAQKGTISIEIAQANAISEIESLRYGPDKKDYFWITDLAPTMIMHPYVHELTGKSLQEFADPDGKKLFIEAVELAKTSGEGFINYKWQLKDDSIHIVPKLSFVKLFKDWNWIIGTGIYLDDVQKEIASLTNKLILILIGISLFIAVIIFFIAYQSLEIEKQRQEAENQLHESRERYQALAEASNEGALMVFQDYIYANKSLLKLLGYNETEIATIQIYDILIDKNVQEKYPDFFSIVDSPELPENHETIFKSRNGATTPVMVSFSQISISGKKAIMIITKDISVHQIQDSEIPGEKFVDQYRTIDFSIGFFKTTFLKRNRFTDANLAAMRILGFNSQEELCRTHIEELFADANERKSFTRQLIEKEFIEKKTIRIVKKNYSTAFISVSIRVKNDGVGNKYCEGIVQDISSEHEEKMAKDIILEQMLAANAFYSLPVSEFISPPLACHMKTPIKKAIELMAAGNSGYLIITTVEGSAIGIVTNRDISTRLMHDCNDLEKPVFEIMTSPIVSIQENKPFFAALNAMHSHDAGAVLLKNRDGFPTGLVSSKEVINVLGNSYQWIIRQIESASYPEEIIPIHKKTIQMTGAMHSAGNKASHITKLISAISDATIIKLINLAEKELGVPPVPYAFISFGSVGREEQTLATDQDNAIIYEEVEHGMEVETNRYFQNLANKVCDNLQRSGYAYCKGGFMAKNPIWCKSVAVWKSYFYDWVNAPVPQNLLDVSVLFDFRHAYGSMPISSNLRNYIEEITRNNDPFYYHLAENTVSIKQPVGILGNIQGGTVKGHPNAFDIKKVILPIVSFARIYALKHRVVDLNTMQRLSSLYKKNVIHEKEYRNIVQVYEYLMQLRFGHQVARISEGNLPNNYLEPSSLSDLDITVMKKAFAQINSMYTRLNLDFKRGF